MFKSLVFALLTLSLISANPIAEGDAPDPVALPVTANTSLPAQPAAPTTPVQVTSTTPEAATTPEAVASTTAAAPAQTDAPATQATTAEAAPSTEAPSTTTAAEVAPNDAPAQNDAPAAEVAPAMNDAPAVPAQAEVTPATTPVEAAPTTPVAEVTTEAVTSTAAPTTQEATTAAATEAASTASEAASTTTEAASTTVEAASTTAAPAPSAPAADVMMGDAPASEAEVTIDCDAKILEMDACARRAMFMANPVLYESPEQVESEFCTNVTEHIRCMRDYKQCLSSFPRQVFSIVLFNIKKVTKNVCESNESRSELVDMLHCFREKRDIIVITEIAEMLTRNLDYIATLEGDAMVQNLCCGYAAMQKEAKAILNEECNCNSTTAYWDNIAKSLLTDASDLLCGSYPNYDVCTEKAPSVMQEWNEKVKIIRQTGVRVMHANGTASNGAQPASPRASYTALTPAVKIIKKLNAQMTNEVDTNGKKETTV